MSKIATAILRQSRPTRQTFTAIATPKIIPDPVGE